MRSEVKVAKVQQSHCREKLLARKYIPVPQTDTGSRVENTKVSERTLVKELGKNDPVTSEEGVLAMRMVSRSE